MKEIEEINRLEQSQLFNLSLSSKELFHSNFLYYHFKKYHLNISSIFQNILPNDYLGSFKKIRREFKNTDIFIEFENKLIIIELKIKSVPNKEQLQNYKSKFGENNIYFLFSLIEPDFNLEELNWKRLSIEILNNILNKLLIDVSDNYDKYLISDYLEFINNLHSLVFYKCTLNINDSFNFYGEDFKVFKRLRIHDLFLKNKLTYFKKNIDEIIKEENLRTFFHIVNGKGVLNVELQFERFYIGIMIDGDRYNKYLTPKEINDLDFDSICSELKNTQQWFNFEVIEGIIYPKNNGFNKYRKMKYTSKKISSEMKLSYLLTKIISDIEKAKTVGTKSKSKR